MRRSRRSAPEIPDWFLESVQFMRSADCGVRNIETELRHAMTLENLDPRLRAELQGVRDSLGAVKVSLSVMDMIAGKVLGEIVAEGGSGFGPDAAESATVGHPRRCH